MRRRLQHVREAAQRVITDHARLVVRDVEVRGEALRVADVEVVAPELAEHLLQLIVSPHLAQVDARQQLVQRNPPLFAALEAFDATRWLLQLVVREAMHLARVELERLELGDALRELERPAGLGVELLLDPGLLADLEHSLDISWARPEREAREEMNGALAGRQRCVATLEGRQRREGEERRDQDGGEHGSDPGYERG